MRVDQLHPAEISTCVTLVCRAFAKDHKRIRCYSLIAGVFRLLYLPAPSVLKRRCAKLMADQAIKRDLITHMLKATHKGASGQTFTLDDYFAEDSPIIKLKKDWLSKFSPIQQ
jgi:hypothetical protein